jgi:hypothetical protein
VGPDDIHIRELIDRVAAGGPGAAGEDIRSAGDSRAPASIEADFSSVRLVSIVFSSVARR